MPAIAFSVFVAAAFAALCTRADETIYADTALNSDWQDWSWSSVINYAATDVFEGTSSISVNSSQYAALSLKDGPTTFEGFAGLSFDIAGDSPDVSVLIQSTTSNNQSSSFAISSFPSPVVKGNFTTYLLDFSNLPPGNGAVLANDTWDRITFQAGGDGAVYHIDNIILLTEIVVAPQILSAEPLGTNLVAVRTAGAVNTSTIQVALNGHSVPVSSSVTYIPVDTPSASITYLVLSSALAPGNLTIDAGNGTQFSYVLPAALSGSVNQAVNVPISKHIYGVNFPTSASYIQHLGVTLSRWGGNAVTAYNPFGGFTNAGNDWYFENRANDDADDWVGWVEGAGSDTLLTIPALDWVSKDATSYSYPKTIYPDQESFDPYNADAGDGLFPNGSYVTPVPDQSSVYSPWNTTIAQKWLAGLANKPVIVTIDNEIEIASNTHQDMHPVPIGYDEELQRVLNYSAIAKAALPNVQVAAPSTCAWYYYWRSIVGDADVAAHNNSDFLPWFLKQVQAHDAATKQRHLDYLDLHYYFQADTSANDDAAKALRLRLTRSLWDPTYVDESWVGTSAPSNSQPNPTKIQLIPRIQTLINQLYPGTKFSISEWSSTADTDITGGLVTADALGIFGRFKLDAATYWSEPDELGPIGLAYWLYRGYNTFFGSSSAQVSIPNLDPDTLGVYAGTEGGKNLTLVVVNKSPTQAVALNLGGVPAGTYFLRHFGGASGLAKFQTTATINSSSYFVVPAYSAVFIQQQTSPAPPVPCAAHYYQCGGLQWKGATCCEAPFTCVPAANNPYYSQCL